MKNLVFSLVLVACLIFSCNQKEKYQGKWTNSFIHNLNLDEHQPTFFKIEEDSIKFNFGTFDHWHSYKLEIIGDRFLFNGVQMDVSVEVDTLVLNNYSYFLRDHNVSLQTLYYDLPILDLALPELETVSQLDIDEKTVSYFIYFGKRMDNGEYSLQLNDKYADIKELRAFFHSSRSAFREELLPYPIVYLFIDKTTPLIYIDQIFDELTMSNKLKVGLINNINLERNDSEILFYEFEILSKRLPFIQYDGIYRNQLFETDLMQPPPPPSSLYFKMDNSKTAYFFLIHNRVYYNNAIIDDQQLQNITNSLIKNNYSIISLYDLESEYYYFLKMNSIISNEYDYFRDKASKSTFNKPLNFLNYEQLNEIKKQIPMKHLWSYSIPHYQLLVKNNNPDFGIVLKPIDSLLPK